MTLGFTIRIVFEVLAVAALIVGFLYEDRVIAFEDCILEKFRSGRKDETSRRTAAPASASSKAAHRTTSAKDKASQVRAAQRHAQAAGQRRANEAERRAREAAYCRNQAAGMRARAAVEEKGRVPLKRVDDRRNRHVA